MSLTAEKLLAAFQRAVRQRNPDARSDGLAGAIHFGCETRTVPAEYRWDGLRRGERTAHPRILFQATLSGWGTLEQGKHRWRIGPDTAFLTVLPSPHVYYLPPESPHWSFFWLLVAHPFVVGRLTQLARRFGPVLALPGDARFMLHCLDFFERSCRHRFEDSQDNEGALIQWALGLERHLLEQAHPKTERDAMLQPVRRLVLANLHRWIGIEELARERGLSRSHFTRAFRLATGQAPAAFVLDVRLAEVRHRLTTTAAPLKEIASQTGFADAIHLSKAFRRIYHTSPGLYRRLQPDR